MTTIPDSHRYLLDADVAALATVRPDGFPHTTGTWFLHEDGELKLSLNTARLKTRHLMENPRCSLFVLDLENPYKYLEIRARAHVQADEDYAFARRLGAKYGGADLSEHDAPGDRRVVITLEPINVYAVDMSGG